MSLSFEQKYIIIYYIPVKTFIIPVGQTRVNLRVDLGLRRGFSPNTGPDKIMLSIFLKT